MEKLPLDTGMSESALEKARLIHRLDRFGLTRTHTGYYYIAHYYPLRAMRDVGAREALALAEQMAGNSFETYLHFPFCEAKCSFCHFHKEIAGADFGPREEIYLRLLKREIELYQQVLGRIPAHSFYIGGGTPSLMSNRRLSDVLSAVQQRIEIKTDAEVKFELFPKHYSETELTEKLRILRGFGVTDLVIDLESGNQASLDYVGRRMTSPDAYLRLVNRAVDFGFNSIVTALMPGLPHETFESLEQTLEQLCAIPQVKVINTFPLIIRKPDPIHRQFLNHRVFFPTTLQRDALWIFARDYLRARGFTEGPISYLHRPSKRPAQQADKFECVNLLGFGTSSFGYWNGNDWATQHFNFCNREDYARRVSAGELPLWRVGLLDQEERARRKLIFGLANCKTENLFALETRFGISVDAVFGQVLNALLELGLIELQAGEGISYTEDGLSRLEEISYFLGSDFVKDACAKPVPHDRWRRERLSHHYYVRIPKLHRQRFETFVSKQPREFMSKIRASITDINTVSVSRIEQRKELVSV
jgi:oxygen-independent coproporphyrinogen-3 oxidase